MSVRVPRPGRAWVRPPAVAGTFYPAAPAELAAAVDAHLRAAARPDASLSQDAVGPDVPDPDAAGLRALVVPHAGYVYSGPTAGCAYRLLPGSGVRRVVLLGPAHRVPVDGLGVSTATAWRTPLGEVPLDAALVEELTAGLPDVVGADRAHGPEHSLEVQLPFLQRTLEPGWTLAPFLVGRDVRTVVATVVARAATRDDTLVIVSSDLSHYLPYARAREQDGRTVAAVLARDPDEVGPYDACGCYPLRGLLVAARELGWMPDLLDARNSGDTAGDHARVVGYAAFAWRGPRPAPASGPTTAQATGRLSERTREGLLALASETIDEALATGRRPRPDLDRLAPPGGWEPEALAPGAAFVTLHDAQGRLAGCIGSLTPDEPLAASVARHAYDAAFRDPRFSPLTPERAEGMRLSIAVLGEPSDFASSGYDDLVARVPRGLGLTVRAGAHRATFLPVVWSQLPDPASFVAALWRKAGLAPRAWPAGIAVEVYPADVFGAS